MNKIVRNIMLMVLCLTAANATAQPSWGRAAWAVYAKAPSKASSGWVEQLTNGDCEGTDVTNFVSYVKGEDGDTPSEIINGIGYNGSRGIRVHALANAENDWDSQFFITTPDHDWHVGDRYRLEFRVRADIATTMNLESHYGPHDYNWYIMADYSYSVTKEWQLFTYEGSITADQVREYGSMHTVAFDLNILRGEDNDFYFDDMSWMSYEEPDIPPVNPDEWVEQVINGDCEGNDASCFYARTPGIIEDQPTIEYGIGYNGSRGIRVQSIADAEEDWTSQFFLTTPHHIWHEGDRYRLKFKVRAEIPTTISLQSHHGPGEYNWHILADDDYYVNTEWREYTYEGYITTDQVREFGSMYTIAFDLNVKRDVGNTYYFDDMSWQSLGGTSPDPGYEWKKFFVNGIQYETISSNTVEVVGHDLLSGSTLTIPETVNYDGTTYTVTSINDLSGIDNVSTLNLPNTVTTIGNQAFVYSNFVTINLPASLTTLGGQVFQACQKLKTINVESANTHFCSVDGVLFSKDMKTLWRYPEAKESSSYEVPSPVELLEVSAFDGCRSLTSVTLPETFTSAWWLPFGNCSNLRTLICRNTNPNENGNMFEEDDEIYSRTTLYVPRGSLSAYQSIDPWKNFKTIKEFPSQITLTANSYEIEYGDPLPTFGYSASDDFFSGEPDIYCNATTSSDAGTYDITIRQGSVTSISTLKYVNGKLTIRKAPLKISVGNYVKQQGEPNPEFKVTYSGFKNNEDEKVLTKKPTVSCSATKDSAPGDYPITLSGATAKNYDISYQNGTLTISSADDIVVTAMSYTITYGDAIPTLEYTISGGSLEGKPSIRCAAGAAGSRPDAGIYDIIIEKGTVTNYNVTFVKGTLIVMNALLTVSVGNYTKYEGEEMPTFNVTYTGFKNNDTKSTLTKEPIVQCEANKWSPAGTYDITLSGGEAKNYDFTYKSGTLTVKHIYSMTLSAPSGHGSISYSGTDVREYKKFDIKEGNAVTLTFKPDDGYHLSQATLNGRDISSAVSNNRYTVTPTEDMTVIASFEADHGNFSESGITYAILSAPEKTVALAKGSYAGSAGNQIVKNGTLTIPATITHDGQTWNVVGITDNAFNNCTWLKTITIPASMRQTNVGIALFTGCTNLAEIYWNANFDMTNEMLGGFSNPNLLFFSTKKSHAPAGVENEIIDGVANRITLTDATADGYGNFYCSTVFTATTISYTHNYSMESAYGGTGGWETLALPFTVQKITHERAGDITPFAAYDGSPSQRPFWLYSYSSSGFVRSSRMEANVPYIICMPNNGEYDSEYQLPGRVTFSAQNAAVAASTGSAQNERPSRNGKTFMAAYKAKTRAKTNGIYAINAVNDLYAETYGRMPGSVFVNNLRSTSPFEAVMTTDAAAGRVIDLDFAGTDGIMTMDNGQWIMDNWYGLDGQRLNGQPSRKGVYIVNGKKSVIK